MSLQVQGILAGIERDYLTWPVLSTRERKVTETMTKALDEKFCSDCGTAIKIKAEICPKCGVRQMVSPTSVNLGPVAANGKSRVAAALLAVFLGGFGIHKFYLGQVGMGFLYLIFCWTFIPAIVAFIEFILFLTMSDQAFNQKYGQA